MATVYSLPADFLGVGDIAFAFYNVDGALAAGDVVAGANLKTADSLVFWEMSGSNIPFPVTIGSELPGTWRSVCKVNAPADGLVLASMFVRVS